MTSPHGRGNRQSTPVRTVVRDAAINKLVGAAIGAALILSFGLFGLGRLVGGTDETTSADLAATAEPAESDDATETTDGGGPASPDTSTTTTSAPTTTTALSTTTTTTTRTTTTTTTTEPRIPTYVGEIGHLIGADLTMSLVDDLQSGAIVELDLHAIDQPRSEPVPDCSSSARCRSLQWVYKCGDGVDTSALHDLGAMLDSCFGGIFALGVDPGDDGTDGWSYMAGVWELEGVFAVDFDLCMQGSCGVTVRRLPPEVVAQVRG